jgi:hypothetical protein
MFVLYPANRMLLFHVYTLRFSQTGVSIIAVHVTVITRSPIANTGSRSLSATNNGMASIARLSDGWVTRFGGFGSTT